jgi:hypothetical protein
MSGKLPGFRKRLAKVERALAATAEQEKLADCVCKVRDVSPPTVAFSNKPEEFEAEMNQKCPVHGFRHLGHIVAIRFVKPGGNHERCRLDELLEQYYARESQHSKAKLEHDCQEA